MHGQEKIAMERRKSNIKLIENLSTMVEKYVFCLFLAFRFVEMPSTVNTSEHAC
jgi:hypothetical protein